MLNNSNLQEEVQEAEVVEQEEPPALQQKPQPSPLQVPGCVSV
jgi:hypothetical protein